MRIALEDLSLDRLLIVSPVREGYPVDRTIEVCSLAEAMGTVAMACG